MRNGIRFLTLAVLVTSLTMVGWSSDKLLTAEEYVSKTKAELTEFMNVVKEGKSFNVDDYRTIQKPVEEQKRKLERIQKNIEAIQPPPKYVDEHMQVRIVIDDFVKGDETLLKYAKSGSGSDLATANDYFQVGMNNMDEAPTFFTKAN